MATNNIIPFPPDSVATKSNPSENQDQISSLLKPLANHLDSRNEMIQQDVQTAEAAMKLILMSQEDIKQLREHED